MNRLPVLAVGLALLLGGSGCSTNFPYGMSLDRHNFASTVDMPLSLELKDTVTDEIVWTLDIPVGKKAVVDFEHVDDWYAESFQPATPATKVAWVICEPQTRFYNMEHEQALSGNPVLLRVKVRDSPEIVESSTIPLPPVRPKAAEEPAAEPQPEPDPAVVPPQPEPAPQPQPEPAPAPAPQPKPDASDDTPDILEEALEK